MEFQERKDTLITEDFHRPLFNIILQKQKPQVLRDLPVLLPDFSGRKMDGNHNPDPKP